jgi:hypothetical protein
VTTNPKPASLEDVRERFAELVYYSEESNEGWAEVLGTTAARVRSIRTGEPYKTGQGPARLGPKELLLIDDFCAGHFLTPPEREYCEKSRRHSSYSNRYRRTTSV